MKDNPVRQTAALKARVRRMRVQYRRRAIAAAIICFILGCVAGAFAYRWYVNSNPDLNVAATPAATEEPVIFPEDEGDPLAEQDAFPEVEKGSDEGDIIFPEDDEPTPAPETEAEDEGEPEPGTQTEAETEVEPKGGAESETEAETETEPETEPETEIEPEAEPEPEAETEAEPEAEPETEAETEAETEPETEAETEAEPETKAETETEPEAETEAETKAEAETEAETGADTAAQPEGEGAAQVVAIVPYGESFTYTTQINPDGSARVEESDAPYETISFTQTMKSYMRPTDFAAKYSTQYKLQGDEAGAGFELVLNDYTGSATIVPQNVIDISLRSESGNTVERGYQLMDAEIAGNYGIALNTNTPKMLYKRYQYSTDREEMFYLVVTTYNGGEPRMILFELESDEPEPTPEIVYGILQKGIKSDEVAEMQTRLIELGYLQGTADGAFGGMTEEAIKAAQEAFGMEPNGIADNAFQQKLYEGMVRVTPEPGVYTELKMGDTGDSVIQLQLRLRELGYYDGKADGGYGEMTESAVKQAQLAYSMEMSGVADQAFQEKLFAPTPAPTATPSPEGANTVG